MRCRRDLTNRAKAARATPGLPTTATPDSAGSLLGAVLGAGAYMDATRNEAIRWCREKGVDFRNPIYPPPEGWAWADAVGALVLTAIFTDTEDSDITSADAGIQHSAAIH